MAALFVAVADSGAILSTLIAFGLDPIPEWRAQVKNLWEHATALLVAHTHLHRE
jgi:hypothetical protein